MPEDKELEQKEGESKEDYIARLKKRLEELFDQHIKENEGQPRFASDIEDPAERVTWEGAQLRQWKDRHAVLCTLKGIGERTLEEIHRDNGADSEYRVHYELEWRQRWLTPEGKGFLDAIVAGLKKEENLWDDERGDNQVGLIFGDVEIAGGKKYSDFHYVHWSKERMYRDLCLADLQGADLTKANFQRANLWHANLQGANLRWAKFQKAELIGANLQEAELSWANFQGAVLTDVNLQGAILLFANLQGASLITGNLQGADVKMASLQGATLWLANLQGANLWQANLQGADLFGVTLAGAFLKGKKTGSNEDEQEISERSANFADIIYSREWRGPQWAAYFASLVILVLAQILNRFCWLFGKKRRFGGIKYAWRKRECKGKSRREIDREKYPPAKWYWSGRPTTFFAVDTSGMDATDNPMLKRYIDDEDYVESVKEHHPVVYCFWAMSANCGRSIGLWVFWCLAFIVGFAALYAIFPLSGHFERMGFWTAFYSSVQTFATFGFGKIDPSGVAAEIISTFEVVCGYIFFGGLVALFTSTLTRRA